MASSSDFPDGRKSPGSRKVPNPLATNFFAKSKKGDLRSPTVHSPSSYLKSKPPIEISVVHARTDEDNNNNSVNNNNTNSSSSHNTHNNGSGSGSSATIDPTLAAALATATTSRYDDRTEPIAIPASAQMGSHYRHHKKLAPSTSFNTHYRSISRSMNDLGNIFSRGRSPPNRDVPPRPSVAANAQEYRRKLQEGGHSKGFETGGVPSISVMQPGEHANRNRVLREGWLNVIDSHTKKASMRDAWKLHYALIIDGQMFLYKPPSSYQIRAFEIDAGPPSPQRPQSAPATASAAFDVSSLRHRSTARHPELVLEDDGSVKYGTVEALCHELMFTQDSSFVHWAARSLSGWTGPETVLSMLLELSALKDSSARIGEILQILATATPGLLLEPGCYNCARLLAEKAVGPHNRELAKTSRMAIEKARTTLQKALGIADELTNPLPEPPRVITAKLTAEAFMRINPEVLAAQIHLFHLRYARAWNPVHDVSLLLVSPHLPPPSQRNPLVFSTANIHFLGDRVLDHVLSGEPAHHLELRVAVLSQWIQVAQLLKSRGDMVGYLAIMMAVLSPPILRLRETWSAISPTVVEELRETGGKAMRILERRRLDGKPETPDGRAFVPKGVGVDFPCSDGVPFFGDLVHCMDDAYSSRDRNIDYQKMVQGMNAIAESLANWKKDWIDTNPELATRKEVEVKEIEQIQQMLQYLNANNQTPPSANSTVYFDKSLACEPSSTGLYLQSHYHQTLPLSTGANIPLILTDIRANFSLFDRSDTLAISGTMHKKTPSSGLGSPISTSGGYPLGAQSNQNLRPPLSPGPQQVIRRTRSFPPSRPTVQTTGYDDLDFTTHERTAVLHGGDNAMLRAIRDVAGVGQQLFHSKDGELVLKSITDESQSRPTSVIETTSNRQSMVSRRYSQVLSANVSPRVSVYGDSIPNTPLREGFDLDVPSQATSLVVVPKGGTLERLVDILVLGVEEFSRRMNRSEGGDSRPPMLRMDMDVFTITFFATYRSYCSPIVLIDYLKKRLVGSKSAASFSGNESDDVVFPDWTGVDHVKDDSVDWALVAKIHFGILDAIHIWISEFYLDFHCDQYLAESFTTFLDIAAKELAFWRSTEPEIHQLRKQADEINSLWHNIKDKFASLSFTPSTFDFPSPGNATSSLTIPQPDNISQISEFIDILDVRVAQFFASVRLVDWMFTFEQLEIQSAEPMGFFVPKIALLTHDEDGPIQDIFFLLRNLRREKTTSTLLQTLPKPLRNLCALHQDLSNWILSQVAEPKISVEVRSHRLATLLKALTICRQRMSGMDLYDSSDSGVSRHVPSFVGSAISTALVRPESRAYGFAWQLAVKNACGFVSQCETLEQVIPESVDGEIPAKPLTTSVGWMLERLLEIVCHVPNMVVENNRLINFDKRRYVYNFINNFTNHTDAQSDETHPSRHVFAPKNLEPIDMRALRDSANRENQLLKHGRIKVFWKLVHREQEKLRRDAKQRETMDRLHRNQMRAEHKRQPTAVRVETERKGGKRLGVNSIFKAVRPISIAFTSGWTPPQHTSRVVRASELPAFKVEHGRRPVATIDLKQVASITCPRKSRDKGLWKITPGSGTSYVLQATSEKDLDEWLKIVAAVRGLNVSEGAESIDLLTMASATRMPQPVFGVSLEELCRRDNVKVPIIIEGLLTEIEMRGLAEVGLYRVPGSLASINALKAALDSGEDIKMDDDRWYDINVIAGAFKSFMRELPVQALEQDILDELRDLTADIPEEEDRVPRYRETMMKLQPHNYYFLRRVYIHFARVASNAAVNKMHAVNLAIVFGMGLSPNSAHPFGVSPDLGLYQTMVKTWITYADQVFPESEDDDSRSASVIPVDSGGMPSEPNSPLSPVHDSPPGSSLAEEQWCGTEGSAGGNDGAAGVV